MIATTPQQAQSNNSITIIETEKPCNKRIFLDDNGVPKKDGVSEIIFAKARSVEVDNVEVFASILKEVGDHPNQIIMLGTHDNIPIGSDYLIGSKNYVRGYLQLGEGAEMPDLPAEHQGKPITTREKRHVQQSNWFCMDYDKVKGMPEQLVYEAPEEWMDALNQLIPEFRKADKVLAHSTSSRISYYDAPAFDGGWHLFLRAQAAQDIEDFGRRLLMHSLTTEFGFMREIYNRKTREVCGYRPWSIFDPTTFSRERILYEGSPVVDGEGLAVLPASIEIIGGEL